ncbi:hypothetical protein PQU92_02075 [Asticcacaulis sp. BYS171W]|uniref:Uncharacterized protein n=1 Tax=Asticcacaulis aquaticus TaxID=2984212 RepID=A0ABT5HQ13_9CAUL|nr:hypothetical protein [Asticcacaulis aquaticus]MDC7682043.1 hypothetical protein [Asticcacaulis aquaticus]
MLRHMWVAGLCVTLLSGVANAKEKYEWRYDRSNEGLLTLWDISNGKPLYDKLSLFCADDGSLVVEARGIILWTDVGGGSNPENYERFALETAVLRLEASLEPANTDYSGWALARYAGGTKLIDGIVPGEFIVVRAIHRKPVMERSTSDYDLTELYPAPNFKKSEAFRKYCANIKVTGSVP